MKLYKNTGSGLVDYVIPTAIVGIILGLALYSIFNDKSLIKFISASLKGDMNKKELIIGEHNDYIDPGELGGTPNNPQMSCVDGICTIDFGDYVLRGIPEQFGTVTTAKRGGEETLAYVDMLLQMANILEEQGDIAGADLLRLLANQAKKMAAAEIASDEVLTALNNIEQQILSLGGTVYENVEQSLNSIDVNNLKKGDCQTLLAAAKYMEKSGIINQNELDTMVAKILEIQQQDPPLTQDQIDFINDLKSSPEDVNTICANAAATLTEEEKAILIDQNKILYSVATNSLEGVSNYVDSTNNGAADAGRNFDVLYQQVLSQLSTNPLVPVIQFVGNEVQKIGNAVTPEEVSNNGYSLLSLTIPENAGIETAIAAAMLDAANN